MNEAEMIEEAKTAFIRRGFWPNDVMWACWLDAWRQSAENEREACALTCETPPQDGWHPYGEVYEENISKKLASAIRARGNK